MIKVFIDASSQVTLPTSLCRQYQLDGGEELFPSCVDCELRNTCDSSAANKACWGLNPSCADCLWAQDIIRCL